MLSMCISVVTAKVTVKAKAIAVANTDHQIVGTAGLRT